MKIIFVLLALNYVYVSVTGYVVTASSKKHQNAGSTVGSTVTHTESHAVEHKAITVKYRDGINIEAENSTLAESLKDTNEDSSSDTSVVQSGNVTTEKSSELMAEGLDTIEKLESIETVERYPQRRHPIETATFLSRQEEINYTPDPNLGKRSNTLKIVFKNKTLNNKTDKYVVKNRRSKFDNFVRSREALKDDILRNVDNSVNLDLYSKNNSIRTNWTTPGRKKDQGEKNEYLEFSGEHKPEAHRNNNSVAKEHCCHDHMGQNDDAATGTTTANVKRVLGLPYFEPIGDTFNLTTPSLRNLTSIKEFLHQINEFIGFEGKFYVCAVLLYCFIVSAVTMFLSERSPC